MGINRNEIARQLAACISDDFNDFLQFIEENRPAGSLPADVLDNFARMYNITRKPDESNQSLCDRVLREMGFEKTEEIETAAECPLIEIGDAPWSHIWKKD